MSSGILHDKTISINGSGLMMGMRIGIIGLGTVGRAIHNGFGNNHEVFVHDTSLDTKISDVTENARIAYIAVPTPSIAGSGECDTSLVEEVLEQLPDGFKAVIKSTIIPGTTVRLQESFPRLKIACSPEFLRTENSEEDFQNQDILIVGTQHDDLAMEVFEHHVEAGIVCKSDCFHVTPTLAELIKYAKNSFYSMKVIFANQFYDYCEVMGEDWSEVKEIITKSQMQPIGDSHLEAIHGEGRGFGGKCLPKDTIALYEHLKQLGIDYRLFDAVLEDNRRIRPD